MSNEKFYFASCPYCSTPYVIYPKHVEGFRRCNHCDGPLTVGEPFTKDDLSYIQLLPNIVGESFETGGYVVENGVLVQANVTGDTATIPSGVIYIAPQVFSNNTTIKKVTLPKGLLYIGESAFGHCANLRELTLPSTLVAMGNCAFAGCRKLAQVDIPQTLKCAGYSVFHSCDNLVKADFPMDMVYLGGSPYRYCKKLRRATIPNCVVDLMVWFTDVVNLEEVVVGAKVLNCNEIPTNKLQKAHFVKTTGWATEQGYNTQSTMIDQAVLSNPKKSALLLYKLKKQKTSLVNKDVSTDALYTYHQTPNVE